MYWQADSLPLAPPGKNLHNIPELKFTSQMRYRNTNKDALLGNSLAKHAQMGLVYQAHI